MPRQSSNVHLAWHTRAMISVLQSCAKHHLQGVWGRAPPPAGSPTGALWALSPLAFAKQQIKPQGVRGVVPTHICEATGQAAGRREQWHPPISISISRQQPKKRE